MSGNKSTPLTKDEVMQLVSLVEANSVVYSKATNASNNQMKEAAWGKITSAFNSITSSGPRKPEQLRLKWENLKKAARKRNTKIKMNCIKTGGGKPDYIPPDEALDKVADILGPTCEGYTVPFGGDAIKENVGAEVVVEVPVGADDWEIMSPDIEAGPSGENNAILKPINSQPTPTRKKFFFKSSQSLTNDSKKKQLKEDVQTRIKRNNAIAEYYTVKKENLVNKQALEIEMLEMKKMKLEFEIHKLEKDKEMLSLD